MVIDGVHEDLHLALGLHEPAHDAEGPDGLPILRQEAGNDRMIRFLARADAVVAVSVHAEIAAPVVQGDAPAGNDDARSEAVEVALNIRYHIAFFVGSAQVDRAAVVGICRRRQHRFLADEAAPPVGICIGQPVGHVGLHEPRVGDVLAAVRKGQLHGFNLPVEGLDRIPFCKIKALGDIHSHQHDQAMAVGRNLPHVVAPVIRMDGLNPLGLVFCQIVLADVAAGLARPGVDRLGQLAVVQGPAARVAEQAQRRGVVGKAQDFPGLGRPPLREKGGKQPGKGFFLPVGRKAFPAFSQHGRQVRHDGVAVLGIVDGRLKESLEGQLTELLMDFRPGRRCARYHDRRPAPVRHGGAAFVMQVLPRQPLGRPAAAVQAVELAFRPDEGKGIAAQAVARRLQDD